MSAAKCMNLELGSGVKMVLGRTGYDQNTENFNEGILLRLDLSCHLPVFSSSPSFWKLRGTQYIFIVLKKILLIPLL